MNFYLLKSEKYTILWHEIEEFQKKDLPQSALKSIDKLLAEAQKDNNGGWLLKGLLVRRQLSEDISPDSAQKILPILEENLKREKSLAKQSMYHAIIGTLYARQNSYLENEAPQKSINHLLFSVNDIETLAKTKASDYVPFIILGKDEKWFDNDLLNVVSRFCIEELSVDSLKKKVLAKTINYYRTHNNREAELILTLDSIGRFFNYESSGRVLESLIKKYEECKNAIEIYIQLCNVSETKDAYEWAKKGLKKFRNNKRSNFFKNKINNLTKQYISLKIHNLQSFESQDDSVSISSVNVRNAKLFFYETDLTSEQLESLRMEYDNNKIQSYAKKIVKTVEFNTTIDKPYEQNKYTIPFKAPHCGIYLLKVKTEKGESDYSIYRVSNLSILYSKVGDSTRIMICESKNGCPVSNAKIVEISNGLRNVHISNNQGIAYLNPTKGSSKIYVYKDFDQYSSPIVVYSGIIGYQTNVKLPQTYLKLFTDRSIYRPGQKVHVGGIVYQQNGDKVKVMEGNDVHLHFFDANRKQIKNEKLRTDSFGVISTDFIIPSACLNGMFTISSDNGRVTFQVEEYKRPTFKMKFDKLTKTYTYGDTVMLTGNVSTYYGFNMPSVKVIATITNQERLWHDFNQSDVSSILKDTIYTDKMGNFTFPVYLNKETSNKQLISWYNIHVQATSLDGETETASTSISIGSKSVYLSSDMPSKICKEKLPFFQVFQRNVNGNSIQGDADYEILLNDKIVHKGDLTFNTKYNFNLIDINASGKYIFRVYPKNNSLKKDTLIQEFTLFSMHDPHPVENCPLQLYSCASDFSSDNVNIQVATSLKDIWMRIDRMSEKKLIDSELYHLSDTAFVIPCRYKSEYGNGMRLVATLIYKGKIYSQEVVITKPRPNKSLTLKWNSFRDHTSPGKEEIWRLQVLRDGKVLPASVFATLYDYSLDKYMSNNWQFSIGFNRNVAGFRWHGFNNYNFFMNVSENVKYFDVPEISLSHFDRDLFYTYIRPLRKHSSGMIKMTKAKNLDVMPMSVVEDNITTSTNASLTEEKSQVISDIPLSSNVNTNELRADFSETAYFSSHLITDEQGQVNMEFVLPQSLTTWKLNLFAHSKEMNYAMMDTLVTVSKPFIVQPNIPRFLRVGDNTQIATTVRNISNTDLTGILVCEWINPHDMTVISSQSKCFNVESGNEDNYIFSISVSDKYTMLICKITANTGDFTDGEQHYIPILSDMQEINESIPLSLSENNTKAIDLSELFDKSSRNQRLSIEYTANPAWMGLSALPYLSNQMNNDILSLATSFYSLQLAAYEANVNREIYNLANKWRKDEAVDSVYLMLERNKDLKQIFLNETPWVLQANQERNRLQSLAMFFDSIQLSYCLHSSLDRLKQLQNSDGGWSWYPGMKTSLWITIHVARILSRICHMCIPQLNSEIDRMLYKANLYMDKEVDEIVQNLKKENLKKVENPSVNSILLEYLYVMALQGWKSSDSRNYLLNLLTATSVSYNIYDKAIAAFVMAKAGKIKQANIILQSLLEHTVSTPEMGRFFDTERAPSQYGSYKIPTQVAAMETINQLLPEDNITIQEMTRWLLQSKRTQMWDNEQCSVDALYWLFMHFKMLHDTAVIPKMTIQWQNNKEYTSILPQDSVLSSIGYFRYNISEKDFHGNPSRLIIGNTKSSIAFGAVYAQCLKPVSEITSSSNEIQLSYQVYVLKNSEWKKMDDNISLSLGDKIKIRYEINVQRNLDFVCLKEGRPACLEPILSLSGYDWKSGCYYEIGDASSQYFFNNLSKGKHVLETEMYVNRRGIYFSSSPSIQSIYSPEFSARSKNIKLIVQ